MSESLQPHGTAAHQASLSFTIYWSLLKLMSIELVMPSKHLILCHPPLLLSWILPNIRSFPMSIQDWFPLRLTGLISLLSKRLLRVFSSTTVKEHQFFSTQLSLWSMIYMIFKIMAFGPITSWKIDGQTMETAIDFIFLGSKITADGDCSYEIKRHFLLGRKAMTNLDSILKIRQTSLCQRRSI